MNATASALLILVCAMIASPGPAQAQDLGQSLADDLAAPPDEMVLPAANNEPEGNRAPAGSPRPVSKRPSLREKRTPASQGGTSRRTRGPRNSGQPTLEHANTAEGASTARQPARSTSEPTSESTPMDASELELLREGPSLSGSTRTASRPDVDSTNSATEENQAPPADSEAAASTADDDGFVEVTDQNVDAPPAVPQSPRTGRSRSRRASRSSSAEASTPAESYSPVDPTLGQPEDEAESSDEEPEPVTFQEITPGVASADDVMDAWGDPSEKQKITGGERLIYAIEPFPRVIADCRHGVVVRLVIDLPEPVAPLEVAEQLGFLRGSVLVKDANGNTVGEAYPDHGTVLRFEPGADPPRVTSIVIATLTAEPFLVRALSRPAHDLGGKLRDLDQAIKLSPNLIDALSLNASLLLQLGEYEQAAKMAHRAVQQQPDALECLWYQCLAHAELGDLNKAQEFADEIASAAGKEASWQALAENETGQLLLRMQTPDYALAAEHFQNAISIAEQAAAEGDDPAKVRALNAAMHAHLGMARAVAWGAWNRKEEVAPRWLNQAVELSSGMRDVTHGDPQLWFAVCRDALDTYAGLGGGDIETWIQELTATGKARLRAASNPRHMAQIHYEYGMALAIATTVFAANEEWPLAKKYGQMAVSELEQAQPNRREQPKFQYAFGETLFHLGLAQMAGKGGHAKAIPWYDRAKVALSAASARATPAERSRLGDYLVSMGVSYWQVGQKETALELTEEGATLLQEAVQAGLAEEDSLQVVYANLARIHSRLGNLEKSAEYEALLAPAEIVADEESGPKLR